MDEMADEQNSPCCNGDVYNIRLESLALLNEKAADTPSVNRMREALRVISVMVDTD